MSPTDFIFMIIMTCWVIFLAIFLWIAKKELDKAEPRKEKPKDAIPRVPKSDKSA